MGLYGAYNGYGTYNNEWDKIKTIFEVELFRRFDLDSDFLENMQKKTLQNVEWKLLFIFIKTQIIKNTFA